jgi:hypothetical protein
MKDRPKVVDLKKLSSEIKDNRRSVYLVATKATPDLIADLMATRIERDELRLAGMRVINSRDGSGLDEAVQLLDAAISDQGC